MAQEARDLCAAKLWLLRNYHYYDAALVLHAIEDRLKRRYDMDLLDLLRTWWLQKRTQAVTTEQFEAFLAAQSGDAPYWHAFFADWVRTTPCPVLSVHDVLVQEGHVSFRIARAGGQLAMPDFAIVVEGSGAPAQTEVSFAAGQSSVDVDLPLPPQSQAQLIRLDPQWRYPFSLATVQIPGVTVTYDPAW